MTELGSRSDFLALQRSGRGKTVMLSVVLVAALGGSLWAFFGRPERLGNPEDPTKVLVVNAGSAAGYSLMLKDMGFDAAEGSLDAWERKADEALEEGDEGPRRGLAGVLHLADLFGYGYVAVERPGMLDVSGVDVDATPEGFSEARFAVWSVGDLAHPHRVTVNPPASDVLRDPVIDLLAALFEQPVLAELKPDNDDPTIEVIQRRDRLQRGLDRLGRRARAESLVGKVTHALEESLASDERAPVRPRAVSTLDESATPMPLPSGDALLLTRGFRVTTYDALKPNVELAETQRFTLRTANGERRPCAPILGGELSVHESLRMAQAAAGDALLTQTLTEGSVLWTWGGGQGCSFVRRGAVVPAAPGLDPLGVPHVSGQVARTGLVQDHAVLSVVEAGHDHQPLLGMLAGQIFGAPVWWDAHRLVVPSRGADGDALFFFEPARPLVVLQLPATVLAGEATLHEVAAVPSLPALVVTAGAGRHLYRLDFPASLEALFQEHADTPPRADGMPVVVSLDTQRFRAERLSDRGRVRQPTVSPDGQWVAATWTGVDVPEEVEDPEIGVVDLRGGPLHVLTRNDRSDVAPRFSADGRTVLFETEIAIPRTRRTFVLVQSAEVPVAEPTSVAVQP